MYWILKNCIREGLIRLHEKPFLTVADQIQHLKDKGITFDLMSEEEAENYLYKNNYYFKLTSYRKNYLKYVDGENQGKYINLDFGYLKDLAIIDMELRYLLVQLSLDIEHYIKVQLLRLCEVLDEDGYLIVEEFKASMDEKQNERLEVELKRSENTIYCGDLYSKYSGEYPLWVFLEMVSFGTLLHFYSFFAQKYQNKGMIEMSYMLRTCKDIRNAAAHSSCIINDLLPKTKRYKTSYSLSRYLSKTLNLNNETISKKMSCIRVQEIITLLFVYKNVITSTEVKCKTKERLLYFKNRMLFHIDYYDSNETIKTSFLFLSDVIDNWYLNE